MSVYDVLLRLYPAAYRTARGDEMLDTLRESAGERRWPPAREVTALVAGALRAHAGRDRCTDVMTSWMTALRAAALMLLVLDVAGAVQNYVSYVRYELPGTSPLALPAGALAVGAVLAVLGGRYLAGVLLTVAALVIAVPANVPLMPHSFGWGFPLVVLLLVPLVKRPPPPAAGLLRYAPVLVPALLVVVDLGLFPEVSGILHRGAMVGLWAGGLLWLAIDERVAMALGLLLLKTALTYGAAVVTYGLSPNVALEALSVAVVAVPPLTLLLTSAAAARDQAIP